MRALVAIVATLAVLIAGCAKPQSQVIGTWKMDAPAAATGNAKTDEMLKQLSASMTLTFKDDKTFSFGGAAGLNGTYTVSGHTVTMTPVPKPGTDPSLPGNQPQPATLSDDGKSLTVTSSGFSTKFVKTTG